MFKPFVYILFIFLGFFSTSALAINCQRAVTPLENTICNSDNLRWLNSTMTLVYSTMLIREDPVKTHNAYTAWKKSMESCTSASCIERAYYEGISELSDTNMDFDWEGKWWNMRAANKSGGTIKFSSSAQWSVIADMRAWAGLNRDDFTAEARKIYGMAVVENIADANNCKMLIVPKKDGSVQVHTNADWGCGISMPTGVFLDGRYERAEKDPRPPFTLLTMGIFNEPGRDRQFRQIVGEDYQKFVDTANVYIYQDDIDNIGAKVVSMWVRGAANSRTAIIMYTPEGRIWAARIAPAADGKLQLYYYSSEGKDLSEMPHTLASWKLRFLE